MTSKKWWEFIDIGYKPTPKKIQVRQLGIKKVVVVRTKLNGGVE